jgi:hypothetical protein
MGSHLTEGLVALGAHVHAFVRATSSGALNNIWHLRDRLRVHFADLTDRTSVDYLVRELRDTCTDRPFVFHLGAQAHVGESWHRPYAYLLVASLAYVPSFSISVISSAPLTRRDIDDREAVEHVLHASWVSLLLVGGAAGVFALVGGRLVELVLGHSYGGGTGREIGHLVIELAPWMVGTVAFYVTFPVLFVLRRQRLLIALAVAALVFDAAVSLGLRTAGGLFGIALGLGIAVIAVVSAILRVLSRDVLLHAAAGLARLAVVVGATAAIAFGVSRVFLPAVPAAAAGLAAYSLLVFVAASRLGLGETWAYVRALH